MLMITPEALRRLRISVTSTAGKVSVSLAGPKKQSSAPKLSQQYRRKLIDQTAAIMSRGEPSVFAFEGFMRHGLRSGLCRKGWGWHDADAASAKIVSAALTQIGAKRPTVAQGQPEWTQEGVILVERERCIRCGWKLPDGHWKFCSRRCLDAHHSAMQRRFTAAELGAVYDDAP